MAATAFSNFTGAAQQRNFVSILNDAKINKDRPSLLAAALRNSFGKSHVQAIVAVENTMVVTPVDNVATREPKQALTLQKYAAPQKIPSSVIPVVDVLDWTPATRTMAMDLQRRQQQLVAVANRRMPAGCQVMAWNILPLDVFKGDLGRFLMIACDFHAYAGANTMLLPTMPAGAAHLSLPRHPLVASERHIQSAHNQISHLRDRVAAEHRRANLALQNGDLSQIYGRTVGKAKYCAELAQIVDNIAAAQWGNDALRAHRAQFEMMIAEM